MSCCFASSSTLSTPLLSLSTSKSSSISMSSSKPIIPTLTNSISQLALSMAYVKIFVLLSWLLIPKTSTLHVLLPYCKKGHWTKVTARSSSSPRHPCLRARLLSRAPYHCPHRLIILRLHLMLVMTSVLLPSRRPLTTSSPLCANTIELVASVFVPATSGLLATGVLWFLRFTRSRRFGICVPQLFKRMMFLILQNLSRHLKTKCSCYCL